MGAITECKKYALHRGKVIMLIYNECMIFVLGCSNPLLLAGIAVAVVERRPPGQEESKAVMGEGGAPPVALLRVKRHGA